MGSIAEEKRRNLMDFLGRADGIAANGVSSEGGDDSTLVLTKLGKIIKMEEFQFLRSKYQKG